MEELKKKLDKYIKEKEKKIRNAESSEDMKYNYYGASSVLMFLYANDIISSESYKEHDTKIDLAQEEYFQKAKTELVKAHKKLF